MSELLAPGLAGTRAPSNLDSKLFLIVDDPYYILHMLRCIQRLRLDAAQARGT
jgi:hypothetical protein